MVGPRHGRGLRLGCLAVLLWPSLVSSAAQPVPQALPTLRAGPLQSSTGAETAPALADEGAAVSGPAAPGPHRLALGLGILDLRARLALTDGWDVEARAAWWPGAPFSSARLYWDLLGMGSLRFIVGMEGGAGAGGWVGGALAGMELPLAQRLKLSGDVEAQWVQGAPGNSPLALHLALYAYVY